MAAPLIVAVPDRAPPFTPIVVALSIRLWVCRVPGAVNGRGGFQHGRAKTATLGLVPSPSRRRAENRSTERRGQAARRPHRSACLKPLVLSRQSPRSGGRCGVEVAGIVALLLVA